ncbi:Protein ABHD18 [Trichoplax sp. H2]|nr:Protein ABHD18 [Trichoplax sp. H2]|eukprot:RDD41733.1 Protein ABHD18 [Trichoplax sp. H2]
MTTASKFDQLYRRIIIAKYFTSGWGDVDLLRRIVSFRNDATVDASKWRKLVSPNHPVTIDKRIKNNSYEVLQGHFTSPIVEFFGPSMLEEIKTARFEVVLPKNWNTDKKPMCIHLAGTGDHFFWRRRHLMAIPLLKEYGIGSILLENPYYGVRKPKEQRRSSLKYVADLFLMGIALVLESSVLLHWCQNMGFGPLCLHGISMGGHMASLAATAWPESVAVVPCLSWSTASIAFTEGVMTRSCNWKLLEKQYNESRSASEESSLYSDLNKIHERRANFPFNFPINNSLGDSKIQFISEFDPGECYPHYLDSSIVNCFDEAIDDVTYRATADDIKSTLIQPKEFTTTEKQNWLSKGRNILKRSSQTDRDRQHIIEITKYVFDEVTHLQQYPCPVDTSSIIAVVAEKDAYIPRNNATSLEDIWPGCEIRYLVGCGHVDAFLTKLHVFRKAISDALAKVPTNSK